MTQAKPSLLIVDDIAANRAILSRRFNPRGFQITEADCGVRALELIKQQHFDLVLLDVMMPDLDGLQVLKRIRQEHSAISLPVIMVTAKNDSIDIAEALDAGANDYITKPVDFVVAMARLTTLLGRKQAEEQIQKTNQTLRQLNETLEHRVATRTAELMAANEQLKKEVVERERTEDEIRYLAHHDALTGLGNRILLQQELSKALLRDREGKDQVAVLFVDLDSFKSVNDTLGHSIGDALLKAVALRIVNSLRDKDRIARLGGDEFAIVHIAEDQPEAAGRLATRLIEVIRQPYVIEGHQVACGASIGIAIPSASNSDPEQLLKSADLAMYRAKADGRGTYRFFEAVMDARAQARRLMELDLRAAQLENAFEIYYQPIVDITNKRVSSIEALLRWRHPDHGFVPPSEFIRLAEEIGVISPLGEWVLRQACTEAVRWPRDIKVAVNVSPVQFRSRGLVAAVMNALKTSGLPASRLEVEITESILLEDTDANLSTLNQLRDLGVKISMDDFGTGYSSLNYLRSFRFDKIKIDQSFIRDLARKEDDSINIVRAIADLGISLGMTTTAEGVETEEQLKCVRREGCVEVQGYFFSAPRPASEIPSIIARLEQGKTEDIPLWSVAERKGFAVVSAGTAPLVPADPLAVSSRLETVPAARLKKTTTLSGTE
jgi:diguanylate cyclase (GGDEF)-like protein